MLNLKGGDKLIIKETGDICEFISVCDNGNFFVILNRGVEEYAPVDLEVL